MTTKVPCYIEFTDSGHFARLVHKTGYVIAELLIDNVLFRDRTLAAYDRTGQMDIPRPLNPFLGSVDVIFSPSIIREEIKVLEDLIKDYESTKYQMNEEKEKN